MANARGTMKALDVVAVADPEAPPSQRLALVEKPVPSPGPGEVLIRMEAAPCNPADLAYLWGRYGVASEFGKAGGFEGGGGVVESGGGLFARFLRGKRVAVATGAEGEGTWAEYFVAAANTCLPVGNEIPPEQAATFLVNPFTAFGLLDRARELGSPAVIQNAGASQVGRLVLAVARTRRVPVISTVRRDAQKELLLGLGAEHVLVTTDPQYEAELKSLAADLGARVAFDAVAGEDTARLLSNMPPRSTAIVYGGLSMSPDDRYGGTYPVGEVIFASDRIEGFWLVLSIARLGARRILGRARKIRKLFEEGGLETAIRSVSAIEDYPAAIDAYASDMSAGKAILKFGTALRGGA